MAETVPLDNAGLMESFRVILSIENFSPYILDIARLVYEQQLSKESMQQTLRSYSIDKPEQIKEELLDLLLVYINLCLNDHVLSEGEKHNLRVFKLLFKIREGDFFRLRFEEVEEILHRQFKRLYQDSRISAEEALFKVDLQEVFDLGYDDFESFSRPQVDIALAKGAHITELDTAYKQKTGEGHNISDRIQKIHDAVWNRDNGKCSVCGNFERELLFQQMIPASKGGSGTVRNTALVCENCANEQVER